MTLAGFTLLLSNLVLLQASIAWSPVVTASETAAARWRDDVVDSSCGWGSVCDRLEEAEVEADDDAPTHDLAWSRPVESEAGSLLFPACPAHCARPHAQDVSFTVRARPVGRGPPSSV